MTEPDGIKPDFEAVLRSDPMGAALLDRLERLMLAVGLGSTVLTVLVWSLSVSLGWLLGFLISFLSVVAVRRLMRKIIAGGASGGVAAVILGVKLLVVLGVVWIVLTRLPANPLAFAGSYGVTLAGLVLGSVVLAPRPDAGVPDAAASHGSETDGEMGSAPREEQSRGG